MRIGIPRQHAEGERLVAATPKTVSQLVKLGYDVVVEKGAGAAADYPDADYQEAGAELSSDTAAVWAAEVVTAVTTPSAEQLKLVPAGTILIAPLDPGSNEATVRQLTEQGVTALSLDAVPRISRAQSMDVLSTNSNVAGYRGVIEAAATYGGMFTGQVTAAGKTNPAQVFVIGAGVAGLAAIGAAVSLGGQVRAFDVRPEVGEQIESMGAAFVREPAAQQEVSTDGYAKPLTEEQLAAALELYATEAAKADVVVTTALVRGKAVRTITKEAVAAMRPGSVIVDLAASGGGNCELTVPGEKIITDNGVTIIGYTDFTSRMAHHTSQLLGTNIVNLLKLLTPAKDGVAVLDFEDVIIRGMTLSHAGETMWPPPPVQVSAAAPAPQVAKVDPAEQAAAEEAKRLRKRKRNNWLSAAGALAAIAALTFLPLTLVNIITIFVLAVVVGFYVINNVSHSLHTPLMAQTNAISGIILVGALLQLGSDNWVITALAFVAATVASINIFGGFLVAHRMIGMFRKEN